MIENKIGIEIEYDDWDYDNTRTVPEDGEQAKPAFVIDDDIKADWAVRKIAARRTEYDRLKAIADDMIARINGKLAAEAKSLETKTEFLQNALRDYFFTVPHKETKTQAQYALLSGTLKMKKGGLKTETDADALLKWLKATGREDYIKVTEAPRWGELKKTLVITEDGATTEDGETVAGVTVTAGEDVFEIIVK
ncbi:MAG: host-nuclease inhibitor Gam family protein [Oscillospiraceae bacterium]|nr:host-nuclease inhibitor Gam family protein [Oscillospiraceae bacterium]